MLAQPHLRGMLYQRCSRTWNALLALPTAGIAAHAHGELETSSCQHMKENVHGARPAVRFRAATRTQHMANWHAMPFSTSRRSADMGTVCQDSASSGASLEQAPCKQGKDEEGICVILYYLGMEYVVCITSSRALRQRSRPKPHRGQGLRLVLRKITGSEVPEGPLMTTMCAGHASVSWLGDTAGAKAGSPEKEKTEAKVMLMQAERMGQLEELKTQMSAIVAEAQSTDPWTSRARPSFLYVIYIVILAALPMGFVAAFDPQLATNVANGFKAWLAAVPDSLWALFGAGYLGYTGFRSWDKRNGVTK